MRDGVTGCARTCATTVGRHDSGSQGQWVARQWVAKVTQLESHPAVVMAVTWRLKSIQPNARQPLEKSLLLA